MLGGDEDYAVRSLRTVNRCSRGILEDFHADDIGRVDGGKRRNRGNFSVSESISETEISTGVSAALDDDTVNDVERFRIGIDSRLTADADRR